MQTERIFVGLFLVLAFLWLRARARALDDADRPRAILGSALFLVPALLAGRWLFEKLPFGRYENLVIELAGLAAVTAVAAFVFLRPRRAP
jgi:hypothetical protein